MVETGDCFNNATGENSLDIVQVLDRTGSMSEYAGETSTDRKIDVLRYAADEFIQMMKPGAGNRLGIVQFNQDVVLFPPPDPGLKELTADNVPDFRGSVASIVNGGTTSIGDGLHEADGQLSGVADPNPIRAILLISDGMENTPDWIADYQADLIAHGIKVYALGLGYGTGIDQGKLADLAAATAGDYRITNVDLEFRKFFLEVLADAANWEVIEVCLLRAHLSVGRRIRGRSSGRLDDAAGQGAECRRDPLWRVRLHGQRGRVRGPWAATPSAWRSKRSLCCPNGASGMSSLGGAPP